MIVLLGFCSYKDNNLFYKNVFLLKKNPIIIIFVKNKANKYDFNKYLKVRKFTGLLNIKID